MIAKFRCTYCDHKFERIIYGEKDLPRCPNCHSLMKMRNVVQDTGEEEDKDVFGYNK